jgi:hypothetical protein
MNESDVTEIAPMTKASFTLTFSPPDDRGPDSPFSMPRTLIVGIHPTGMSPLETTLLGKAPGDTVSVTVARTDLPAFFGPSLSPPPLPEGADSIVVTVSISTATRPDRREVIQAMAAGVSDCGGGCGCGCGGH